MTTSSIGVSLRAPRYSVSRSVTDRTIEKLLAGLDCPRSLAVWMLYRSGEHQQLVDMDWSPTAYDSSMRARDSYIASELLSKAKFLTLDVDPETAAMTTYFEIEEHCRVVNRRLRNLEFDPLYKGANVFLHDAVRRKVSRLLGERSESSPAFVSSFDCEEWIDSCAWGPGTTIRVNGKATNSANKFQRDVGMTKDCYILVSSLFSAAFPLWGQHIQSNYPTWGKGLLDMWLESGDNGTLKRAKHCYFDKGDEILTVPKKAKTHRVIKKPPGLNCFFQLGIGKMIAKRLLRNGGYDLRAQDDNQRLAFLASLNGKLATIDHRSASDCISTEYVRGVLPSRWFDVMDSIRSKCGSYQRPRSDDKPIVVYYEKFSSMGNGFTFPLQSLLFAAAAEACCEYIGVPTEHVGVYGDDVVIPVEAVDLYCQYCDFCGLKVNQTKSFSSGPFRESCGAHYWQGADLKPLYIKERLRGLLSLYRTANGIRRLANRNLDYGCDNRFVPAWLYLRDRVAEKHRFSIPEGYGDGGFVEDFDMASPPTYRRWAQFAEVIPRKGHAPFSEVPLYQGIEGYLGWAVREVPVSYSTSSFGLHLARLADVDLRLRDLDDDEIRILTGAGNEVGLRRTTKARIERAFYPKWYNLGPWITSKGSLFLRAGSA